MLDVFEKSPCLFLETTNRVTESKCLSRMTVGIVDLIWRKENGKDAILRSLLLLIFVIYKVHDEL